MGCKELVGPSLSLLFLAMPSLVIARRQHDSNNETTYQDSNTLFSLVRPGPKPQTSCSKHAVTISTTVFCYYFFSLVKKQKKLTFSFKTNMIFE